MSPAAPRPTRRLATIDLGTNTVRLLVADVAPDGAWTVVHQDQRVTRLGEGLTGSGRLGDAARTRTAETVADYVIRARRAGAVRLCVVATSAVREAADGGEFAAALQRRTGEAVAIISGEEEARLTLRGVLRGLGDPGGTLVIFDIGGGSTEYVLARDGRLVASVSLRLGVVPLAERHPLPGRADRPSFAALRADVAAVLDAGLPAAVAAARPDRVVGTAGTVTTLAALDLGLAAYEATRVQGHVLTRAAVERQAARLAALDVAGRAALPCLEPGRADLILPGVAIVLESMDRLGVERLVVSDFGLREGLLAAIASDDP